MLHDATDVLSGSTTVNDLLGTVARALSGVFGVSPIVPDQPVPASWTQPATWGPLQWLLVGGAAFLLFRAGTRHNPRRLTRRKARLILHHSAVRGHRLTGPQRGMFGAVAHGVPLTRLRNPFPGSGVLMNAHRPRSLHARRSPVRFHGAFADVRKAESQAARLGGVVKGFTVRGQRRYGVMTGA